MPTWSCTVCNIIDQPVENEIPAALRPAPLDVTLNATRLNADDPSTDESSSESDAPAALLRRSTRQKRPAPSCIVCDRNEPVFIRVQKVPSFAKWGDNWPSWQKYTGNLVHFSFKLLAWKRYKTLGDDWWAVRSWRFALTCILESRGVFSPALTLLGGAGFIAWRLRCLFLVECQRAPRHFWSSRARLSYGSAPRPTKKKALCHTRLVGETVDKYRAISEIYKTATSLLTTKKEDNDNEVKDTGREKQTSSFCFA